MHQILKHLSSTAGMLFCAVSLVGCAAWKSTSSPTPEERRFALLQEQIQTQRTQIERLTAALEKIKDAPEPEISDAIPAAPKPLIPSAPVEKLVPSASERAAADENEEGEIVEEEDSIADSSQAMMNFYYEGNRQLKDRQYEDAIKSFRQFLKASPEHIYADRAQFQIAESHFRNKEYGLSIVASNQLESKYPESFRLPAALFTRSLSYSSLGQTDSARITLRALLKRFPDDPIADKASRKLAELGAPVRAGASSGTPLLLDDTE